jgi:hypothetical protein
MADPQGDHSWGARCQTQSRNVRFDGLLQGWFAGRLYLVVILFWGFAVRSASPAGRRPEGLAGVRVGHLWGVDVVWDAD